jgi:hypothetical protein
VRNRALAAIGVLRVREAGPALREMFEQHRRRDLGTRVLASLSRIGDPAQADLFRELLSSSDPEHRRLAVEGLGRVADPSTLPAFKKDYQREKNANVQLAYNFAIVSLGDRAFLDAIVLALGSSGARARRARDYVLELGLPIAPDLYPYLNDRDPEVRGALCDVLAQLGEAGATPRLSPLLADPNSRVADRANRAIETLRRAGGGAAPSPGGGGGWRRPAPCCSWRRRPASASRRGGPRTRSPRRGRSSSGGSTGDRGARRRRRRGASTAGAAWAGRRRRRPSPARARAGLPVGTAQLEETGARFFERAVPPRPRETHLAIADLLAPHALVAARRGGAARGTGPSLASAELRSRHASGPRGDSRRER